LLPVLADAQGKLSMQQILLREIYQELIKNNTTDSEGNTTHAAEAMVVIRIANLILYKQEGFIPDRDLIIPN